MVETFLADITRQVAGDRLTVDTLMPLGVDPHSFEPTPADVAKVSASTVLVTNGVGLEAFLDKLLQSADGKRVVIEAANGLTRARQPQPKKPMTAQSQSMRKATSFLARPHPGYALRRKYPRWPEPGGPRTAPCSMPPTRPRM